MKLLRIGIYASDETFAEALVSLKNEVAAQQSASTALMNASDSRSNNYIVHVWGLASGDATKPWITYLGPELKLEYTRRSGSSRIMVGIIMSWIDGGTLEQAIHGVPGRTAVPTWGQHASTAEKLRVLCQMANALYILHFNRTCVVHGDLKPANVMMSKTPRPGHTDYCAKLTDFGLAKIKEATTTVHAGTTRVVSSHVKEEGTFRYMAPEQFCQLCATNGGWRARVGGWPFPQQELGCLCLWYHHLGGHDRWVALARDDTS